MQWLIQRPRNGAIVKRTRKVKHGSATTSQPTSAAGARVDAPARAPAPASRWISQRRTPEQHTKSRNEHEHAFQHPSTSDTNHNCSTNHLKTLYKAAFLGHTQPIHRSAPSLSTAQRDELLGIAIANQVPTDHDATLRAIALLESSNTSVARAARATLARAAFNLELAAELLRTLGHPHDGLLAALVWRERGILAWYDDQRAYARDAYGRAWRAALHTEEATTLISRIGTLLATALYDAGHYASSLGIAVKTLKHHTAAHHEPLLFRIFTAQLATERDASETLAELGLKWRDQPNARHLHEYAQGIYHLKHGLFDHAEHHLRHLTTQPIPPAPHPLERDWTPIHATHRLSEALVATQRRDEAVELIHALERNPEMPRIERLKTRWYHAHLLGDTRRLVHVEHQLDAYGVAPPVWFAPVRERSARTPYQTLAALSAPPGVPRDAITPTAGLRHDRFNQGQTLLARHLPSSITVRLMGSEPTLLIEGEPFTPRTWRALELLFAALIRPGLTREALTAQLWPDKPAAHARELFHACRKALPTDRITIACRDDRYFVDPTPRAFACDWLQLVTLEPASQTYVPRMFHGAESELRRALYTYQPLLPRSDSPLVVHEGQRMEQTLIRATKAVLRRKRHQESYTGSYDIAARAIAIDATDAELNHIAQRCVEREYGPEVAQTLCCIAEHALGFPVAPFTTTRLEPTP
jgi:hypothetical protein